MTELDHVVVAALSLEEGVRWVEDRLHAPLDTGGRHLGFGTHNALLRIGSDALAEVFGRAPTILR